MLNETEEIIIYINFCHVWRLVKLFMDESHSLNAVARLFELAYDFFTFDVSGLQID